MRISDSGDTYGNIAEVRVFGTVDEVAKQAGLVTLDSGMISGCDDAAKIVDGKWDTVVNLTDKSVFLTIDFGAGKAVTPAKFHLAPRGDAATEADSKIYLPALNGTTIYGSNDNTNWTALTAASSGARYGWNVVPVKSEAASQSFRYLKISGADGGAIAEIEIYGTVNPASGG